MKDKKTLYEVLSLVFGLAFIVLLILLLTADVQTVRVGTTNTSIGLATINVAIHDAIGVHKTWYNATEILGILSIAIGLCFCALTLYRWIKRKKLRKVSKYLLALVGVYVLIAAIYVIFEVVTVNYRPIIMPGKTEPEGSFPSSHTLLILVIMATGIKAFNKVIRHSYSRDTRKKLGAVVSIIFAIIAVVGVVGRLVSGVHWFTDILASVLLSFSIIFAYLAVVEKLDEISHRHHHRHSSEDEIVIVMHAPKGEEHKKMHVKRADEDKDEMPDLFGGEK